MGIGASGVATSLASSVGIGGTVAASGGVLLKASAVGAAGVVGGSLLAPILLGGLALVGIGYGLSSYLSPPSTPQVVPEILLNLSNLLDPQYNKTYENTPQKKS